MNPNDYDTLPAFETAKRFMEIAVLGGHSYAVSYAGLDSYYGAWPLDGLKADERHRADEYLALCQPEGPGGVPMAVYWGERIRSAMHELADRIGLPRPRRVQTDDVMWLQIQPITMSDFLLPPPQEPLDSVLARMIAAMERLDDSAPLDHLAQKLFDQAAPMMRLTPEAQANVVSVARTIQALAYKPGPVGRVALAEALSYRHLI
jgi:hypothetical protein